MPLIGELSLAWYRPRLPSSPLILFGGGPAPDGLKDVYLYSVPADLAPMRLSKLSSLDLTDVSYVEMDDFLLILRNSPTLTTLKLHNCESLQPSGGSVGLPIILPSLTTCTFEVLTPVVPFLLSVIHTPWLDHLELTFNTEDSVPDSSISSPPAPAFEPTLRRLLSNAKRIELKFGDPYISITFGSLEIFLDSSVVEGFQYLRDVLDSLMDYGGEKGKDLKVLLRLDTVNPTLEELQIFNRSPMVEQLVLTKSLGLALGTHLAVGPYGWLFPELEVLNYNLNVEDIGKLETALENRYSGAQSAQQAWADEHQHPRPLKELRFFSNNPYGAKSVDPERAQRFHILAGGAEVFVLEAPWRA
ncbi:hypothetical protein FS837_012144 [Tulasnella sp. UAMH 9824]|nr:hypothetical protein FS837_012144 [Tulasnella sp. UAMH 9824]